MGGGGGGGTPPLHALLFSISSKGYFMKEGYVLINDALNTFYLRYMASDIW